MFDPPLHVEHIDFYRTDADPYGCGVAEETAPESPAQCVRGNDRAVISMFPYNSASVRCATLSFLNSPASVNFL
jgi:hypothetical protein